MRCWWRSRATPTRRSLRRLRSGPGRALAPTPGGHLRAVPARATPMRRAHPGPGSGCRWRGASRRRTAGASWWRARRTPSPRRRPPLHRRQVRRRDPRRARRGRAPEPPVRASGRDGQPRACASWSPCRAASTPPSPPRSCGRPATTCWACRMRVFDYSDPAARALLLRPGRPRRRARRRARARHPVLRGQPGGALRPRR